MESPTEQKAPHNTNTYDDTSLERILCSVGIFMGKIPFVRQLFLGACFVIGCFLLMGIFPFLILAGFMHPKNECCAQNMGMTDRRDNVGG